jgi:hypothetical protein
MDNSEKSKPEFRVIIAGTRDFSDYQLLRDKCDAILSSKRQNSNIIVVSGTARGADRLGERYARERGYEIRQFPADWLNDEKKAGPIRNAKMADNADALIAFWDGQSRGTKNMIETAKRKGLVIRTIDTNRSRIAIATVDPKIAKLRAETSLYAIEHITGNGMHRGIRWLQDSFNDYYNAISTPGIKISEESDIAHRKILAQKVAIDCIHALNKEQLERLDNVLVGIAKDISVNNVLRR